MEPAAGACDDEDRAGAGRGVHLGGKSAAIFLGPVMAVIPFDPDEDAIRIANDSNYGLAQLR